MIVDILRRPDISGRIKALTEALGTTAIDLTEKKNRACFGEVRDECDWPGPRVRCPRGPGGSQS